MAIPYDYNQLKSFKSGIEILRYAESVNDNVNMLFVPKDAKDTACENCRIGAHDWEQTLDRTPHQKFSMEWPARPYICSAACKRELWRRSLVQNDGAWTKQPDGK